MLLFSLALAQMVGPYGDIVTMKIVRHKVTVKSKGYAFIEMADRGAADLAIDALDGKMVTSLELSVSIWADESLTPAPQSQEVARSI